MAAGSFVDHGLFSRPSKPSKPHAPTHINTNPNPQSPEFGVLHVPLSVENGYLWANEAPGWGVDINEDLAAKYSPDRLPTPFDYHWGSTRRRDGSVIRP